MTGTLDTLPSRPATATGLVSRALLVRFISIVGSSIGFFLPLSVMPLFARASGAAGAAGLSTVALLTTCVACELVTPRLADRIGYRGALALGLVLLGAPTLVLLLSGNTWLVVAVGVVRGAGYAICVVAGGAVTATLIPAERRGQGLALVGLVGGVPSMLALPAGVWIAGHWGYGPVFVATAAASLLALVSVPGLPRRSTASSGRGRQGVLAGLRNPALLGPAVLFTAATAAVGILVTYLPLATTGQPAWVAAAALFAQPAAATLSRCVAGRLGDRHGHVRLLAPGLLLSAIGMACLAATGTPAAVIGGALLFGTGFGLLQNATLTLMYGRAPAGAEGAVSAIWNAAYDLGMAGGALCAGLAITHVGYPATFLITAAVILPALALVRRRR